MKKLMLLLFLVGLCGAVNGQNDTGDYDFISHEVKQGETVRLLSLKYLATPTDIYKMNKFAIDGISPGMVLQIPVKRKIAKPSTEHTEHLPSQEHGSDAENDEITKKTSGPDSAESSDRTTATATSHKVQPGETLSVLARQYGTTVAELKSLNEKILQRGLQSGQVLQLPGAKVQQSVAGAAEPASISTSPVEETQMSDGSVIQHTVANKETLYSIAKKYNVSVNDITKDNEKLLAHGLQAGQVIKIKPNK